MNIKNWEAIAKIMKVDDLDIEKVREAGHSEIDLSFYEGMNTAIKRVKAQLMNLADYFLKEERLCSTCNKPMLIREMEGDGIYTHVLTCVKCNAGKYLGVGDFINHRKQFLRNCGVEE